MIHISAQLSIDMCKLEKERLKNYHALPENSVTVKWCVRKLNKTTQDLTNSVQQQQQQNEKNVFKADDLDQHARDRRVGGYWR